MKTLKIIILVLTLISVGISGYLSFDFYTQIEEKKKEYDIYLNEEATIQFEIKGGTGSLSKVSNYPSQEEYEESFDQVQFFYDFIANNDLITKSIITYYMQVDAGYIQYLTGASRYDFERNHELAEGRMFTQEELDEGKLVAIISNDSNELKLGDKIRIEAPYRGDLNVEVEIIGFYDRIEDDATSYEYSRNNRIYMPDSAIKKISDLWMSQIEPDKDLYEQFIPCGILSPIFECQSEKDYELIKEKINDYQTSIFFNYMIERLDQHQHSIIDFNTKSLTQKLVISSICLFLSVGIGSFMEILVIFMNRKNQRDFQIQLLSEQEKNVQNILMIHQDIHKLKHDLKHFFSQITQLVKNDEKEKVLKLLLEYQEDIQTLEVPAYTQNDTLDMVINHYVTRAKKENIDFTYSGITVQKLPISERKLYILLSNGLDNAFTHCDQRKKVSLNIGYVEPYYRFIIINSIAFNTVIKNASPQHEHGYGIISMKQIIQEIKGEITFETFNDKYICTILIPNMHKK